MTLFIALLLLTNALIGYYCYLKATLKGYPPLTFTLLGLLPYFNLVVLVYILFLPDLNTISEVKPKNILS